MNETELKLASRFKRLCGAIIDSSIAMAVVVPVVIEMGLFESLSKGLPLSLEQRVLLFCLGWGTFLLFNGYLLVQRGQTIGKLVVKTKIVDLKGNLVGLGKLLPLRYLALGMVSQLPFVGGLVGLLNVLMIFGSNRRCLHDYLAGTVVVDA
jgi:uncharacterized RDD family membrane protein YckC